MKLSQALMHRIMNDAIGQSVKRDETGVYIEWNILRIEPNGDFVLLQGNQEISRQPTPEVLTAMQPGRSITLTGLTGILRITSDEM